MYNNTTTAVASLDHSSGIYLVDSPSYTYEYSYKFGIGNIAYRLKAYKTFSKECTLRFAALLFPSSEENYLTSKTLKQRCYIVEKEVLSYFKGNSIGEVIVDIHFSAIVEKIEESLSKHRFTYKIVHSSFYASPPSLNSTLLSVDSLVRNSTKIAAETLTSKDLLLKGEKNPEYLLEFAVQQQQAKHYLKAITATTATAQVYIFNSSSALWQRIDDIYQALQFLTEKILIPALNETIILSFAENSSSSSINNEPPSISLQKVINKLNTDSSFRARIVSLIPLYFSSSFNIASKITPFELPITECKVINWSTLEVRPRQNSDEYTLTTAFDFIASMQQLNYLSRFCVSSLKLSTETDLLFLAGCLGYCTFTGQRDLLLNIWTSSSSYIIQLILQSIEELLQDFRPTFIEGKYTRLTPAIISDMTQLYYFWENNNDDNIAISVDNIEYFKLELSVFMFNGAYIWQRQLSQTGQFPISCLTCLG